MGACLSYCGCRKSEADQEREPLLPQHAQPQPPPPISHRSSLNKVVDILAALYAGKLPSQAQLNRLLRLSLSSELLSPASKSLAFQGRGPISRNGQDLVVHTREAIDALIQFGREKNSDDILQHILYQIHHFSPTSAGIEADSKVVDALKSVGAEAAATISDELPTQRELLEDTKAFFNGLRAVSILLLSSTTLRLLLSDVLKLVRDFVSRVAQDVEEAGQQVQVAAEDIERSMNVQTDGPPMVRAMAGEIVETVQKIAEDINKAASEPVVADESARDAFVSRVQELVYRAHQEPQILEAVRHLFDVLRKYSTTYTRTAQVLVVAEVDAINKASGQPSSSGGIPSSEQAPVAPEDELARVLLDLQEFLERLASGHSLDPFLSALSDTTRNLVDQTAEATVSKTQDTLLPQDPDLQHFLSLVSRWLDSALAPGQHSDHLYAASRPGIRGLEKIYDTGKIVFLSSSAGSTSPGGHNQPEPWVFNLQRAISELSLYADKLISDPTTTRLVTSLSTLRNTGSDFISQLFGFSTNAAYGRGKATLAAWKAELLQDVVGWLLPHILRLFGGLQGMAKFLAPRVEFKMKDPMIEGAVDTLTMIVEDEGGLNIDLVPDQVVVKTWNEVRLNMENVVDVSAASPNAGPALAVGPTTNDSSPSLGATETSNFRRANVSTTNKVHIHIDGVRFGFSDLGYFARVQTGPYGFFGYEDQGLISVHIGPPEASPPTRFQGDYGTLATPGTRTHEGLEVDFELSMDTVSRAEEQPAATAGGPVFQVDNVNVSLPGRTLSAMEIRFDQTRHWILNKMLLQPLSGPVVGKIIGGILEDQVKGALEGLSNILGRINEECERRREASGRTEVRAEDWFSAALKEITQLLGIGSSAPVAEEEEDTETITKTETTWKGVVHTRTTVPVDDTAKPSSPEHTEEPQQEIAIAVGVGTQLFPDEAGPYGGATSSIPPDAPGLHRADATAELASAWDGITAQVQDVKRQGKEVAKEANHTVEDARETVEQAHERWEESVKREEASSSRRGVERRRTAWRSKAFDL